MVKDQKVNDEIRKGYSYFHKLTKLTDMNV